MDCCSELGIDVTYHSLTSGHTHTSADHTHRLQLTMESSAILNCIQMLAESGKPRTQLGIRNQDLLITSQILLSLQDRPKASDCDSIPSHYSRPSHMEYMLLRIYSTVYT